MQNYMDGIENDMWEFLDGKVYNIIKRA